MPEGSPARGVAAGLLLVALAAGVIWTLWPSDNAGTVAAPPASASVEAQPSAPAVEPPEQPVQPEQPEQPAGPATGDYAELATAAELEHPDTDPHIRRWYDWFGYFKGSEQIAEGRWRNKQQLWDSLAPSIRAQARSLGAPFKQPLFDGDTAQPSTADVRWSTDDTGGRGELLEITATYLSGEGRVTTRYWAALIAVAPDGAGRVIAQMEPFDLLVTDYDTFAAFRSSSGDRIWAWVEEQGVDP